MKTLLYIANSRIPTERAHGIQIMNMCEAFAHRGYRVELIIPKRHNHIRDDPFSYYNIEKNFIIQKLFTIDLVRFGRIGFFIQSLSFAIAASRYAQKRSADVVYSRDEFSLYVLSFLKKDFYFESHDGRRNFFIRRVMKKAHGIVVITRGLKEFLAQKGVAKEKILVAPDGIDSDTFGPPYIKGDIREKLRLPLDKKIVMYTGHLYDWKGVDTLARARDWLPKGVMLYFVGGTVEDVQKFKVKYTGAYQIVAVGHKLHKEIPLWQAAADVLVLPNTARHKLSKFYTSPIKLFEYMASRRPIVASRVPSIEEILDDNTAFLVAPDDPEVLAQGIKDVLKDENEAGARAGRAYAMVKEYTWAKRVEHIDNFFEYVS